MQLFAKNTGSGLFMNLALGNGSSFSILSSTAGTNACAAATWHHVALVYDGYQYMLLVNGVIDQQVVSTTNAALASPLFLGAYGTSAGPTTGLNSPNYIDNF
eukprot:35856-Eustigmatos_ZCMA.PRE.1